MTRRIGDTIQALAALARPPRTDEPEWMDLPGHDPALVAATLESLHLVNRWLGGARLTVQALQRLMPDLAPGSELRLADIGTGGADIPRALLAWARRRRLNARVVGIDRRPEIIRLAARAAPEGLVLVVADARSLPFPDRSFDVAACSLVLHHFQPDEAVAVLREMGRVARRGVIINDLVRNYLGYLGAWVLTQLATASPLCRHDGPLSVRKAYTRAEMAALATRAGLRPIAFDGWLGYRVALSAGGPP